MGACDSALWMSRCNFYQLGRYHLCCAVSRQHRLAQYASLEIEDLYGERLLMVARDDSLSNDMVRDELETNHPQIAIEDMPYFYDIGVFNDCEQSNSVLLTLDIWADVHPSLVTIPVHWNYTVPFGLLYSLQPSESVICFLDAVKNLT
ncbi:MAG: hypothetical protein U0M15_08915 [Bacillota bacterium]|nr:hypothetical protein [Bacillota bacterium]